MVIWYLKQIGKVQKLSEWVPYELTANQKNCHFEVSSSLILCNSNEPFLDQIVMYDEKMDFIWQSAITNSVVGLRSYKALPKAKLHPKKSHCHCFVVCCPSDLLQLSESQWNHYIWEVCSANGWDALKAATLAVSIGQQKGPDASPRWHLTVCHTTNDSKVEHVGLPSFASSTTFTWPTDYHFFKHFNNFCR